MIEVYEISDCSMDDFNYRVGLFESFEQAKAIIESCDDPNCLTPAYAEEFCTLQISKIKLGLRDNNTKVFEVRFIETYDEKTDSNVWVKEVRFEKK